MKQTFLNWLRSLTKPKWKCYEIHVVQARMYGCDAQCLACKHEQDNETSIKLQ
jgi:hypothetical protein